MIHGLWSDLRFKYFLSSSSYNKIALSQVLQFRLFSIPTAHYETLQDKLAQLRDAREALDALREDYREKKRREMEELERQRQIQMQLKLDIMRQKKHVSSANIPQLTMSVDCTTLCTLLAILKTVDDLYKQFGSRCGLHKASSEIKIV